MKYFGQIKALNGRDDLLVLELDNLTNHDKNLLTKNVGKIVEFDFDDKREISLTHRRKIYALLGDIAKSLHDDRESIKESLKKQFCEKENIKSFSLSDCTVTTANHFLDYLIDFCLKWNIEFTSKSLDLAKGCYGWEKSCLENHRCCICGDKMQVAHVHAIGIGRNRNKIKHVGYIVMPICYKHHHQQHTIGIKTFMDLYKIAGIRVNKEISKELHLGVQHGKYEVDMGDDINYTNESNRT
ncbi:putative HNHc nuclease [Apilactobacillus xinyiensis]|uniref:putative HNHc nuclease n=1 Tax=Apilactobacillus xinyiensis TaxID=2841032 RepID=UPI00200F866F|nr:putative HNHc nuclease [Apilactobacillus xinyiensis]MCL0330590.1 putative HNHc nuclease [Apilactobacillus xinyiensis]